MPANPSRLTWVWLLLVAATGLSYALGDRIFGDGHGVTVIVLTIALLKVRLIGLEFMELRLSPLLPRLAFEAWVLLIWSGLVGLTWFGASAPFHV